MRGFWKKTMAAAALTAALVCMAQAEWQKEGAIVYASSDVVSSSRATGGSTATSSLKVEVNYLNETITISGNGSSSVYMSTNKGKTWEVLESLTLELSCYMKTSETVLYFKKAGENTPYILTIPKEEKTLTAKYVVGKNGGAVQLSVTAGVEYRKGTNGDWRDYPSNFSTKPYENTGYSLQFRTKATQTKRAGKIVSVKITKRPVAPSITVDYSGLFLKGLKSGTMEYRVTPSTGWTTFTVPTGHASLLDLYTVLNKVSGTIDKTVTPLSAGTVEVRTKATDKKLASAIRLVQIPAQQAAPASTVKVTNTTLVISDASSKKPYEYTILHKGETFDISKVTWKKVTTSKAVSLEKFGSATTITGDVLYVRLASYKDTVKGEVSLASLPLKMDLTITATTPTKAP
ncbi:MAG: hypothetical protein E7256_01125 [Lachnospiraceae bacterium]|nr:hypothetical protein [Lachnospiraceae bacterium]